MWWLAAGVLSIGQSFVCSDAGPFTQTWTDSNRCLPVVLDDGIPELYGDDGRVLRRAFETWSEPACTDLSFVFSTSSQAGLPSGPDALGIEQDGRNYNVVTAVRSETELRQVEMLSNDLLALTLTTYVVDTGELEDADIVVNLTRFEFTTEDETCRDDYDLPSTLTHEVGHLLGFDHGLDPESTMFGSADPCETRKRDLTSDDRAGLCSVYPAGESSAACRPPLSYSSPNTNVARFRNQCEGPTESGGCRGAPGPTGWLSVLAMALLGARCRLRPWGAKESATGPTHL